MPPALEPRLILPNDRRRHRFAWIAALVVHFYGVYLLLRHVNSRFPILTADFAQYYARILRAREFWRASGRLWGYDPFLMAGYPSGPVHEISSQILTVFAVPFSGLPGFPALLSLTEIALLAAIPFAVAATCRLLRWDRRTVLLAFAVTSTFYGTVGIASAPLFLRGFLTYQAGVWISLVTVGFFVRWLEGKSERRDFACFAVCLVLLPIVHPAAALIGFIPIAVLFGLHAKRLDSRRRWTVVLATLASVGLSLVWYRTSLHFRQWATFEAAATASLSQLLAAVGPFQKSWFGVWTSCFYFFLVVFSVAGFVATWNEQRELALSLVVWLLISVSLPFFVRSNASLRFFLLPELLLCLMAARGAEAWRDQVPGQALVGYLVLAVLFAVTQWRDPKSPAYRIRDYTFTRGQRAVVEYVGSQTDNDGRYLIECDYDTYPHFLDLVPLMTHRSILGGSNTNNFLKANFTVFTPALSRNRKTGQTWQDSAVFGKGLGWTTESDFADHLTLYNVHQVLAWSRPAVEVLDRFTDTLEPAGSLGQYRVWKVRKPAGWLLEGSGDLKADYDHIRITDASPGRLILRFHWIDTLKAAPPATARPVQVPGSPLEFIEVDNPSGAPTIDIINAGL